MKSLQVLTETGMVVTILQTADMAVTQMFHLFAFMMHHSTNMPAKEPLLVSGSQAISGSNVGAVSFCFETACM